MSLTKVHADLIKGDLGGGGGQAYNPNILINPSFTVTQRGEAIHGLDGPNHGVIDHNAESYGPDRWKVSGVSQVGGTKVESSTEVDAATGINKLVVKHLNATGASYVYQFIEAVNLLGLYGKEMTFSFSYSDTDGSGIPKVQIDSWDSSVNYKELYSAVPTSLGNDRWACTFTLSIDGTIPDPSARGMSAVIYPNEGNTAPNEWSVWETKLEAGSVATPFIARSHGEELALCQRYYQRFGGHRSEVVATGGIGTDPFRIQASTPIKVTMRAPPTASFKDIHISDANPHNVPINVTGIDISGYSSDKFAWMYFYVDGGIVEHRPYYVRQYNGYLDFDAEL